MKLIPLSQGYEAIVDDEDHDRLSQLAWRASVNDHLPYVETTIAGKRVKMERLVTGDFESYCIDHKDGNPLNNQKCNLRSADRCQNAANRKDRRKPNSPHGFGVSKACNGFRAQASVNGRHISFGPFADTDSAQRAYDAIRFLTSGEFAPLNQPERVQESIVDLREYLATKRREYIEDVVRKLGSKREAAKALGISEASIYREPLTKKE